jgi:hypothetical protein
MTQGLHGTSNFFLRRDGMTGADKVSAGPVDPVSRGKKQWHQKEETMAPEATNSSAATGRRNGYERVQTSQYSGL